jgi:hypothetical protein
MNAQLSTDQPRAVQKFRRKPVVVEGEEFVVGRLPYPKEVCFCVDARGCAHVHNDRGLRRIQSGDWIVRTEKGVVYTETAARFKSMYEPVEDVSELPKTL